MHHQNIGTSRALMHISTQLKATINELTRSNTEIWRHKPEIILGLCCFGVFGFSSVDFLFLFFSSQKPVNIFKQRFQTSGLSGTFVKSVHTE